MRSATTEVRALSTAEAGAPEVTAFLDTHPGSTIFYRPEWNRVIEETYGHECVSYAAYAGGELVGLFPVTRVRHPLFGSKWVAQPYQFDSGAPLVRDDDEGNSKTLIERVARDARAARAHFLEIRHTAELEGVGELGFESPDAGLVTTIVDIAGIELSSVRRGHRRNIRHAFDAGLELEETDELDDLRRFRRMYLAENRDLAAPQAGWSYFEAMRRNLGERMRLFLSRLGGELVGGILTIDDGRTCFARCGVQNDERAKSVYLGKAQIFHTMQAAAARGCTRYNLGISWTGDAGLLANKDGWYGETVPVRLHVLPIAKAAPSPGEYFEKFGLAKAVWRRLPLSVADWAGARVTRWVC